MHHEQTPPSTGWWRIGPAARRAGMSADLLEQGIVSGRISVTLSRLGTKGIRYINAAEFERWLAGKAQPVDLFQP